MATPFQAHSQTENGDPNQGQLKAVTCAACHGADGNSMIGEWPSLAGQHDRYLRQQIATFRDGQRENLLMASFVAGLSDADIADLAAYFSSQNLQGKTTAPEYLDIGQNIYLNGDPLRNLPACTACHGPDGKGNAYAAFPSLAGQHAQYTQNQLITYSNGTRTTLGNIEIMRDIASLLTEEEIEAVSHFVQGLR